MFGFFKLGCNSRSVHRRYRQVYAALCAHHRRRYGLLPTALLSYESVFLYHLAIESGACSAPASSTPTCCRLRFDSTNRWHLDQELADFCSDFGLLLVRIKIEDDVRDSGSLASKTAMRVLRKKFAQADERLNQVLDGTTTRIRKFVEAHLAIESNPAAGTNFSDFSQPTASSFQLIFQAFATLCQNRGGNVSNFGAIGSEVGRSILIGDCFFDFERDKSKGDFNPIQTVAEKEEARNFALKSLSSLGWSCWESCNGNNPVENDSTNCRPANPSVILELVRSAFEKLSTKKPNIGLPTTKKSRLAMVARGGFCDCPCDGCDCIGCGDCGGDDCGLCTSSETSNIGSDIFASCCFGCDDCCGPQDARKKKHAKEEIKIIVPEQMTGVAIGHLNPSGVIKVNGNEFPAKSQGEFIPSGKTVQIIKKETFGFLVVEIESDKEDQN